MLIGQWNMNNVSYLNNDKQGTGLSGRWAIQCAFTKREQLFTFTLYYTSHFFDFLLFFFFNNNSIEKRRNKDKEEENNIIVILLEKKNKEVGILWKTVIFWTSYSTILSKMHFSTHLISLSQRTMYFANNRIAHWTTNNATKTIKSRINPHTHKQLSI